MAYDPSRKRLVVLGSSFGLGKMQVEVLEWDGKYWNPISPRRGIPYWLESMGLAWDGHGSEILIYGGERTDRQTHGTHTEDTWSWNGQRFKKLKQSSSPGPRSGHRMVWDAGRKRVVFFGGSNNDTWEWNGKTWIQSKPTHSPKWRNRYAMAYDSMRKRVVIFGGYNDGPVSDTWEYDGRTWIERTPLPQKKPAVSATPPATMQPASAMQPATTRPAPAMRPAATAKPAAPAMRPAAMARPRPM